MISEMEKPWFILDGPGSVGPAVHTPSRTVQKFSLRRALSRYGLSYPDMKRLPMVGDERGDRTELERIMVGTFPLTIGQPIPITKEFPVGDPWVSMSINLRGELLGGGAPTGTVVSDAPLPLWQIAFTTDLDRDVIEPGVSARPLFRYAQFMQGTAGDITAPTIPGAAATVSFNAVVQLLFSDIRLLVPEDSILDTRRYNTVFLTITTGQLTDIVTTPVQITLQNVFADIEILRLSPRVPLPLDVVKVLSFYKRYAPMTPPGDTIVQLDRIPTLALKRLFWFATSGSSAGVPFTGTGVDTIIDTFRVSSNRRDHFGSAIGGVSRRVLRNDNKMDYDVETFPPGWFAYDTVLDRSILSALATGDLSLLNSILTYQGGLPGTPQVSIFEAGVQKLRGSKGR